MQWDRPDTVATAFVVLALVSAMWNWPVACLVFFVAYLVWMLK